MMREYRGDGFGPAIAIVGGLMALIALMQWLTGMR